MPDDPNGGPGAASPAAPPAEGTPEIPGLDLAAAALESKVIDAIRTCYDPEIPINIHELGLIYKIEVGAEGDVRVQMTLTSPGCPVAGTLPPEVETKVRDVPGVRAARVEVVWDPPWNPSMMSEAAKLQLGMF
jgi:FeS assembly SUF system protein